MSQNIARPYDPFILPETHIYEAVRQFIYAYALPKLALENIYQGWQNRATLPPRTNEFATMYILRGTQVGTTIETFQADPDAVGVAGLHSLVELVIQLDFYSEDDKARQRARNIAMACRSTWGPLFFSQYGMSALYAEEVRDLSGVMDAQQYVRRFMTSLHLSLNEALFANFDHFEQVRVERLENVDVHHKP